MATLQEYLNSKYPMKEEKEKVREIDAYKINEERKKQGITEKLEGGELDLSEFVKVEKVNVYGSYLNSLLAKLILGNNPNLTDLKCSISQLTSLDLSHCPNLTYL